MSTPRASRPSSSGPGPSAGGPEPSTRAQLARSRGMLTLLALLFFGPLLLASALYYASGWRPVGHTNHGTLIDPPRPLTGALFQGKWSLVYVGAGDCDASCRGTLHYMRQTQLGLGRLYTRTQRVFLATAPCCERDLSHTNPDLTIVNATSSAMTPVLQNFPFERRSTGIFIVDPRGNLMMQYDSSSPPRGLLEDLNHLLGLSSIG